MRRPPRLYQSARLTCRRCGESVKAGQFGGWDHVRRLGIKDPRWHLAEVA